MKWNMLAGLVLLCFLLSACGVLPGQAPTPLPTVVLGDSANPAALPGTPIPGGTQAPVTTSGVTASGVLAPDQQVKLAFTMGGSVKVVNVRIGQQVQAGDILVELDEPALQIQLDQANLALNELTSPMAIANAQQTVAADQISLRTAEGTYNWWKTAGTNNNLISDAQAGLVVAQNELQKAQDAYDAQSGDVNSDPYKAAAYQRLYEAQQKFATAQYQFNLYTGSDPAQIDKDKAAMEVAKAKLNDDQTLLAALTGGKLPDHPSGAGYAQWMQARLAAQLAQANLAAARLVSPIAGTVADVRVVPGDYAAPGQMVVVVIDPNHMHVETTDLSERDVPQVKVGQTAHITIKALNQNVTGKVTAISPLADSLGGDVVYKVLVQLDSLPEGALAGMSVTVDFDGQ